MRLVLSRRHNKTGTKSGRMRPGCSCLSGPGLSMWPDAAKDCTPQLGEGPSAPPLALMWLRREGCCLSQPSPAPGSFLWFWTGPRRG